MLLYLLLAAAPAVDCPAWFTAPTKTSPVQEVVVRDNGVDVVHSKAKWGSAKSRRISGLALKELGDTATVTLHDARCQGTYELGVGSHIGPDATVVAILPDSILVEHNDELIRVQREGAELAPLRLIWRSAFTVSVAGSAPVKATSNRARKTSKVKPRTKAPAIKSPGDIFRKKNTALRQAASKFKK